MRRSRFVGAIGLTLAFAVAALAFADGASENEAGVMGKITPTKLDKSKFKPVTLYSGVTTTTTHAVPGQQNAEQVTVLYPKNIKFDLDAPELCSAPINGTTTEQAKAACPPDSNIGTGVSHANLGEGPDQVSDVTVTVFAGPQKGQLRLHAYTPTLGAANTQVVNAKLQNSSAGIAKHLVGKRASAFGPALIVADAPDLAGDAFMLTLFDATVPKSTKSVLGRCKSTTNAFENITIYDDGSKDTATTQTKCKQK